MMKKCYFCKGRLEEKRIEFDGRWGQKRVILKDVPAEVCMQCGEQYFSPEVSRTMEELAKMESVPDEVIIEVPVRQYKVA
ncbi:MAG: type II toxin-antitoxin system MqsA family antitoxin [Candidatus Eremiobacteraeota bacterium]|nr:type II toxin-antitoxin system MqsA family antitoxin [Candidatus Eremiobacteraeota bacterium]